MSERVVGIELGVLWEPNAPDAVFAADDYGRALLALNPHMDDPDQRTVVLIWHHVVSTQFGYPNDEGLGEHRLYGRGLENVHWAGQVTGTKWKPRKSPGRVVTHYIVRTKEAILEVLAGEWTVVRVVGSTRSAAFEVLGTGAFPSHGANGLE